MNANTSRLHAVGQSPWLDGFTREMLANGDLSRCIAEWSVTGVSSDPTTFEHALCNGKAYDEAIAELARREAPAGDLLLVLALQDLSAAADLLRPVFDATDGREGWGSLPVSPLLAYNGARTIHSAAWLHEAGERENLFVKIPGTTTGIEAIEESIFAGIPIDATLLFSREHYVAAAEAYLRGIERRIAADLDPNVASVASFFVSPWDVAVKEEISPPFHNRLGVTMAMRTYKAFHDLLASQRWRRLAQAGARPQRLVWADIGIKDSALPKAFYAEALAAPDTISAMPHDALQAIADHGEAITVLPADGGYADAVLEEFRREGVDDEALAARLQREAVDVFAASWHALMHCVSERTAQFAA